MLEEIIRFFSFTDPNVRFVLAGTVLLGISAGALGCFAILRQRALVGDAVAHSVLPGVCISFIIVGDKDPVALLIGSLVFGWLSLLTMDFLQKNSKISADASIGMILSVFFGLGILLLTYIQNSGNSNQSGLNSFMFGQAASLVPRDVTIFGTISVLVTVAIGFSFKELKLISFDPGYARASGLPVRRYEFLLATMMVMVITVGLQAVGVVLIASMLIIPPAAARYWTDKLSVMVMIGASFGALSGLLGSVISYLAPAMPTGPWMVISALFLFVVSFLFAPNRGEVARLVRSRRNKHKINDENLIKTLYKLEESDGFRHKTWLMKDIMKRRRMRERDARKAIVRLVSRGLVDRFSGKPTGYQITEAGAVEARRIIRLHRLWEVYLTSTVEIAADHVHDDAESMEHILTPEIEEQLTRLLGQPTVDPHQQEIPYEPSEGVRHA